MDELLDQFPGMSAIVISGEVPAKKLRDDLFGFLLKPYDAVDLVELVAKALEGGKTACEGGEGGLSAPVPELSDDYDRHKLQNQLAELVTGLRSLEKDLRERANNPEAVLNTIDQYVDRLCTTAMAVARALPRRENDTNP